MFKSKSKSFLNDMESTSTTIIGAGTTINGDVLSNGDIRIDGHIIGNLEGKAKIIIGANGMVEGDINGKQADIFGKVIGKIMVKELLNISGKANVEGDLNAAQLQIDPSASFNGQCNMRQNTIESIKSLPDAVIANV